MLVRLIRDMLAPFPRIHGLARDLRRAWAGDETERERNLLRAFADKHSDVFFVQIGAHDGLTNDKLHCLVRAYRWRGVLVEPVQGLFAKLVANYKDCAGLRFEQSAIDVTDGRRPFYSVRNAAGMPHWYDQLGSFDINVVLRHRSIPSLEDQIIEEMVNCISFAALIDKHAITQIDLILIDTEGYDLNVLRQIDFELFKPKMIVYEQKHLSDIDVKAARHLLARRGYRVCPCGANDVAILRRAGW